LNSENHEVWLHRITFPDEPIRYIRLKNHANGGFLGLLRIYFRSALN
jgi:hypothetical protein